MNLLSEHEINKHCKDNQTFERAKKLFQKDFVKKLKMVKVAEKGVQFEAEVTGSYINRYHIMLEFHQLENGMQLKDYSCSCPAYATYNGFCKHIAAVMMEVNFQLEEEQLEELLEQKEIGEEVDLFDEYEWEDSVEEAKGPFVEYIPRTSIVTSSGKTFSSGYAVRQGANSSQTLLDAISQMVVQEHNEFCSQMRIGEVDLEVTLNLTPDSEMIELRVGKKQMYVVKNIKEFIEHIRRRDVIRYGKNLEFEHCLSAFTTESMSVVSMLLRCETGKKSYSSYYSDKRSLEIDAKMLDELMKIYEGRILSVQSPYDYYKKQVPVIRKDPVLPVQIVGSDDESKAEIILGHLFLLEGIDHNYILWEDAIYICSDQFSKKMEPILKLMAGNYSRSERNQNSMYYRHYVKEMRKQELYEKDFSSFCNTLLPVMNQYMKVKIKGISFDKYEPSDGNYAIYLDFNEQGDVVCSATAEYGEQKYDLMKVATLNQSERDLRTEYEIRTEILRYFQYDTDRQVWLIVKGDDERLAELIEEGILHLKNHAEVFVSEELKKIKISSQTKITTGLNIKGNLLQVTWDINGMPNEELNEILQSYRRKKKYYRLHSGDLLNLEKSGVQTFVEMQDQLQLTKTQLKQGMAEMPIYRSFYLDTLMKENADKISVSRNEMFERLINRFSQKQERQYELPAEVTAEFRDYQKEGFQWICSLAHLGFGGILADDMGLGKTLQMISFLCTRKEQTHLVICPASLVYNWGAEFAKFAPSTRVELVIGTAAERKERIETYRSYDVLITSYDLLKRDVAEYEGMQFGCEVIDEAQYIKNPSTQAAKAVKTIQSQVRFALTGTPIENRLSELWSIFEYLMPGYLYGYKRFKELFEEKIVLGRENEEKKALGRLHQMIQPFLLRRLKKDVLQDLPDKLEEVVFSQFGEEQEKLYRATEKKVVLNLQKQTGREFNENKLQILAEITRLRQICCNPALVFEGYKKGSAKMDTCLQLIENAIEGGHRILVFSQFATMLGMLQSVLEKKGVATLLLTGSTGKSRRREMVEQFQNLKADVFLISLKAGGTGLNLTAADLVIHYDPWWNVAAQNQATDRAHRIGQENTVTVMKLIAKGTIEERILKLQEKKKNLADKIISEEGLSFSAMTKEELMGLFEP